MKHVMVDLETLGNSPGCKILSIGAVFFDPTGLQQEFYSEVKRNFQGPLIEQQLTVDWWSKQDSAARDRLFENQKEKPLLKTALDNFNNYLKLGNDTEVCLWGNGADFDNAILQVAFQDVTVAQPAWKFYNNRCYRTLKGLVPSIKVDRIGVHHHALYDAKTQAIHAIKLMTHLKAW
jgi:hypothetical protein